ncbi:hypothetical protein [Sinimarinibacterium sp. CAU 1509]|nr:hypothetical protein [Sinimarinibacterium sp. CAU 1509]
MSVLTSMRQMPAMEASLSDASLDAAAAEATASAVAASVRRTGCP